MRMVMCAVLMVGSAASARSDPVVPFERGAWSAERLDITVTLEPEAGALRVEGQVSLRRRAAHESAIAALGVNSGDVTLEWERASAPGATAELNGQFAALPAVRVATLTLAEPVAAGGEVKVSFGVRSVGRNSQFEVRADGALASWVRAWYPVPAPGEGESLRSASGAAGTTTFVMPRAWRSVSAGRLVERREEGDTAIEVWDVAAGTARSFCAGPYTVERRQVGDRDVSVYALSRPLPYEGEHVTALVRSIEVLESRLGKYPWPGFAVAEVWEDMGAFGAASEQGFIMVKPGFFDAPGGNIALFAHEAAHAWWGNTVGTGGPGSLMCGEALAQHGAVTVIRALEDQAAAGDFLEFSRPSYIPIQSAMGYFAIVARGQDIPLSKLGAGATPHTLADSKGMWVYEMLRHEVGDERFYATLRALIAQYSGRSMKLDDLRTAFVEAAPEKEMEAFFAQWLDRVGAPALELDWHATGRGTGARLVIRQAQVEEPFAFDLDVELELRGGDRIVRTVRVSEREGVFEWETPALVVEVRLDPKRKVLMWRPAYGARPAGPADEGGERRGVR